MTVNTRLRKPPPLRWAVVRDADRLVTTTEVRRGEGIGGSGFRRLRTAAAEFPSAPLGTVPAMVEAELLDRRPLIEAVVADVRHRPAA